MKRPQLGLLSSSEVKSNIDDVKVRQAQKEYMKGLTVKQRERLFPHKPDWREMQQHAAAMQARDDVFKVGEYCLLDIKKGPLRKSYYLQRYQLFIIKAAFFSKRPIRYEIMDLKGKTIGSFYANELHKTPANPQDRDHWIIEDIIGQKFKGKKTFYKVIYYHYPKKFAEWLEEKEIHNKELISAFKQKEADRVSKLQSQA